MSPTTHRACLGGLDGKPCPRYTPRSRCAEHEAELERDRNLQPHRGVYQQHAWKAGTRLRVLERDGQRCTEQLPNGQRCPETRATSRLHVDHDPLDVDELLEQGLSPFDDRHCKTKCEGHHNRKSGAKGGRVTASRRGVRP